MLRYFMSLIPGLHSRTTVLRRRQITFFGLVLLLVLSAWVRAGELKTVELVVVLDPGHGGSQMGAVGVGGTQEKDLVLDIAQRTRRVLQSDSKLKVVMTRESDQEVSLEERIELANRVDADVFIGIHANAFVKPSLSGVETFFHSVQASGEEAARVALWENAVGQEPTRLNHDPVGLILEDMHRAEKLRDSSRLAHQIQEELAQRLPFENRGVMQADFVVLGGTRMPSVLIEIGFLSNPTDEKTLNTTKVRNQIAEAIQVAVMKYWAVVRNKTLRSSSEDKAGEH